jgi:molybdate transport system substrate-binding protein
MPALVERFEADTGLSVDLVLGATGTLAAQMENGAPADLFFAADRHTVERLVESGTIRGESVRDYALGELVLVWRPAVAAPTSLAGLVDARFEIVSIANPESAPYGAAAKQALLSTHLWNELSPRVVMGENVAQTYHLVRTGNADAALVARSIVEGTVPLLVIDPAAYAPLLHAAGILEEGDAVRAQRFLDFVLSDDGQKILASYGFGPAPRDP